VRASGEGIFLFLKVNELNVRKKPIKCQLNSLMHHTASKYLKKCLPK
jgi:hypothetical protein